MSINDHEHVNIYRNSNGKAFLIGVDKVGGGTVGKEYQGELWDATIYEVDETKARHFDGLRVGANVSHGEVGYIALDWMEFYSE